MDRNIERNLDTKRHVETHTLRWAWWDKGTQRYRHEETMTVRENERECDKRKRVTKRGRHADILRHENTGWGIERETQINRDAVTVRERER
jgi:hypothetical protein